MSAVVINDDIVHYEVLGRGPGVIFIHGWVGSWRYWIPSMQSVSSRYRAYAVDLWGYGDSGKQFKSYGLDGQVDLLASFIKHLGVAKIALVGHALGGTVAVRFATRFPEIAARVMAINTPLWQDVVDARITASSVPDLLNWLSAHEIGDNSIESESNKIDPPAIPGVVPRLDLRQEVLDIETPCLLVHSENDPSAFEPQIMWMENNINGATALHYMTFEQVKHFPMLEDSSKFNRLMVDFLESKGNLTDLQLKEEWKRRMR